MKIVIARFIEDIDWCYSYKNVIIYNKSSFLYNKSLVAFFCPVRKYIWVKEKKNLRTSKTNTSVQMITKNNYDFQIETIDYEGDDEFKLPCENIYDAVRIYGRVLNCQIKEYSKSDFYCIFNTNQKMAFIGIKTNNFRLEKQENVISFINQKVILEGIKINDKIVLKYKCKNYKEAEQIYTNYLNNYTPPKIIEMPNIGREGHTYAHHIIKNYDNLDNYTIFLQGNPFDHTPKLNKILSKLFENERDYLYKNLSSKVWGCQLDKDQFRKDLKIKQVYSDLYSLKNPKNFLFKFGAGAQFCVSKKLIVKNNLLFYKKILNYLDKECNPIVGHVIERLWFIFFTKFDLDHDIYIKNIPKNLEIKL